MKELTFDPETHTYFSDGIKIPGVTEILTRTGMITPSLYWSEEGRDAGIRLHEAIRKINQGRFDWAEAPPDLADEIMEYEHWLELTGFEPIFSEPDPGLVSEIYRFAGRPDMFGRFPDGTYAVIDAKRGRAQPSAALQLAGYAQLISEGSNLYPLDQIRRFVLHDFSSGNPKLEEYKNRNEIRIFLGLVAACHWASNNLGREK